MRTVPPDTWPKNPEHMRDCAVLRRILRTYCKILKKLLTLANEQSAVRVVNGHTQFCLGCRDCILEKSLVQTLQELT